MTGLLSAAPRTWQEFKARLGDTPLVPVRVSLRGRTHTLLLKLEGANPFGSVKDRTAYGLIEALEGHTRHGEPLTVVESTSGNLGVALAALCGLRGHRFVAIVDPKLQRENLRMMERLGAEILHVTDADENGNYLDARLSKVTELLDADPRLCWTNQYGNTVNPLVHARNTAPELVRQAGRTDIVFVPVSTGGTAAGVATYFAQCSPDTRVVAVDVTGSVAIGGRPGPRHLTGIGANVRSKFLRARGRMGLPRRGHGGLRTDVDDRVWVPDAEAVVLCRKLLSETGVDVGGSSGAAIAACLRHLRSCPETRRPVCLCPDTGEKYRDSVFDDGWSSAIGLDVAETSARLDYEGIRFSCSTSM